MGGFPFREEFCEKYKTVTYFGQFKMTIFVSCQKWYQSLAIKRSNLRITKHNIRFYMLGDLSQSTIAMTYSSDNLVGSMPFSRTQNE